MTQIRTGPSGPEFQFLSRILSFPGVSARGHGFALAFAVAEEIPTPGAEEPTSPTPAQSYDKLFKVLLDRYPNDIVEWLLGKPVQSVSALESAYPLIQRRSTDKLYEVHREDAPGIALHIEVQLDRRPNTPLRMAEYSGVLLRSFAAAIERGLLPASVVIYLDRAVYVEDTGRFQILGAMNYQFLVDYTVVKLWELSPEPILAAGSPGLLPLVPLMSGNTRELMVRSVDKIRRVPESALEGHDRSLLLKTMAILAGRVLMKTEIEELLSSDPELLKLDPFYSIGKKDGHGEGKVEGKVEGKLEGKVEGEALAYQRSIRKILESRFGSVSAELRALVEKISDVSRLESLVASALGAVDLSTFFAAVEKAPEDPSAA